MGDGAGGVPVRKRGKVDGPQGDIVRALRGIGCDVLSLASLGNGAPDLLCGNRERYFLLEVKAKGGKLTPAQEVFHEAWRGPIFIVTTPQEALRVVLGGA